MSTSLRPTYSFSFVTAMLVVALSLPFAVCADQEFPPPDPGYHPPAYDGPEITLLDAVRMTLELEPTIRIKAEDVASQLGVVQQAAGQFDLALLGSVSYELIQNELTTASKLDQQKKRDDLSEEIAEHEEDAEAANALIQEMQNAKDIFAGGGEPSEVELTDPLIQAQIDLLLATYDSAPPAQQAQMKQDVIVWLDSRLLEQQIERDSSRVAAASGRESLRRLGSIAEVERSQSATINLQLYKQFRTGITFTPFLDLSGQTLDWAGKPKDKDYGGPGSVTSYSSAVGFSVQIPLGRGRGVDSAGAFERSAKIDYEATQFALTHAAATSVLNTVSSYWGLVSAQQTLSVQEKSLALQKQIVELVEALVEGDEIPRSEIARMKARQAEVEAQVQSARRAVHVARVTLASVIGFEVQQVGRAPLAADAFPSVPTHAAVNGLPIDGLVERAFQNRFDLRAARQLESSGKILWRAALVDLAPIADVDLKVSYAGFHEGGTITDGIEGSLFSGWTGPSAELGFNYEKPFGNNAQQGMLDQKAAQYRQRVITSRDLSRRIRVNVVQSVASLQQVLAQLDSYREAAGYYQQSADNELEKLRYGRSTLIDAITTEQRLVDASLALVNSQKTVAELIAQLRFESGTLVTEGADAEPQIAPDLTELPDTAGGVVGAP